MAKELSSSRGPDVSSGRKGSIFQWSTSAVSHGLSFRYRLFFGAEASSFAIKLDTPAVGEAMPFFADPSFWGGLLLVLVVPVNVMIYYAVRRRIFGSLRTFYFVH